MEVGAWTAAGEWPSVPGMGHHRHHGYRNICALGRALGLEVAALVALIFAAPAFIVIPNAFSRRHGRNTHVAQRLNRHCFNGGRDEDPPMGMTRREIRRAMRAGSNWTA